MHSLLRLANPKIPKIASKSSHATYPIICTTSPKTTLQPHNPYQKKKNFNQHILSLIEEYNLDNPVNLQKSQVETISLWQIEQLT